jgi:hypothetical protein
MVYLANTYAAQARLGEAIALCREADAMGYLLPAGAPYRLLWEVERSHLAHA